MQVRVERKKKSYPCLSLLRSVCFSDCTQQVVKFPVVPDSDLELLIISFL